MDKVIESIFFNDLRKCITEKNSAGTGTLSVDFGSIQRRIGRLNCHLRHDAGVAGLWCDMHGVSHATHSGCRCMRVRYPECVVKAVLRHPRSVVAPPAIQRPCRRWRVQKRVLDCFDLELFGVTLVAHGTS